MKSKMQLALVLAMVLMTSLALRAQQPSSRQIPFNNVPTTLAACVVPADPACPKPVNVTVQLWQDAVRTIPGDLIFSEVQPSASLDEAGNISFVFGSQTAGGLNPANFPSGSSRFVDVVDPATGASVLAARIPLNANAFALSPGPAGPQGAPGPPGRDGQIQSVAAGDASIAVVGGTGPNPSISVAANGITDAKVPDGALSPMKIAGTAATLGSNIFGGTQVINTSAASGVTAQSTAFNGAGVIGDGNNGSRAAGVWGRTILGLGVVGTATTESGTGVWGEFRGTSGVGIGVLGTSGNGTAVRGDSTTGRGVAGLSDSWQGVYGSSRANAGVVGEATLFHGMFGVSHSPNNAGVFGTNDANGFGVIGRISGTGVAGSFVSEGSGDILDGRTLQSTVFRVTNNGTTITKVLQIQGGADLSERFDIGSAEHSSEGAPRGQVQPGMVVSIDRTRPGKLVVSSTPYDHRAAGVISGAGGVQPGMLMGQEGTVADGQLPVALSGRAYVWVDASYGSIAPGDLLTTSATRGHAMKVTNHVRAQGAVIGKAMTGLPKGKGLILILVVLR